MKILEWAKDLTPGEAFIIYVSTMAAGFILTAFWPNMPMLAFGGSLTTGATTFFAQAWGHDKNGRDRDVEQTKLEQLRLKYNAVPATKPGIVE